MQVPLRIAFRGLDPSAAIETSVRRHAERLERFFDRITGCQVMIESEHHHHHKGRLYHVRVDMTVPNKEIVVARDPGAHHAHEDVYVAIRDAFDAAVRQLEDYVRRHRGQAKIHLPPAHGHVLRLRPEEGFGIIETTDGREVYFHHNSVLDGGFDALEVGAEVRFAEEAGEKGPQASTVHPIGKHHPVG
jgi:ribosomal subunit interface protein